VLADAEAASRARAAALAGLARVPPELMRDLALPSNDPIKALRMLAGRIRYIRIC
jgi:hypothetical protein